MIAKTAESGTNNLVHVPAVGGGVRVRAIPPKLLRAIHGKATKGGRLDFQELMVWKLVYGLADPNFTEDEAREIVYRFTHGTLRPIVDRIDSLSGTDEHLRHGGDEVPHPVRKLAEPVIMATAWLQRFPGSSGARVPRPATNQRRRGSKRSTTGSGSTSSGEDGDPPSTEPGSARQCSECGDDISGMRRDAQTCRESKCRKAAQRRREQIRRWYREHRKPSSFKTRLLPRMRPSDPFEPFVDAIGYIDSYGEGGPVNPWLEDHLDHDGGAA